MLNRQIRRRDGGLFDALQGSADRVAGGCRGDRRDQPDLHGNRSIAGKSEGKVTEQQRSLLARRGARAHAGGNPAHIVAMYAETSDIENVMVAGRFVKRDGRLVFDAGRLARLTDELLASRLRLFQEGSFKSVPVERGPQPGRFLV